MTRRSGTAIWSPCCTSTATRRTRRSRSSRRSSRATTRRSTTKTIFDHLVKTAPPGQRVAAGGEPGRRCAAPPRRSFEQTYLDSYMAHAPMETHSAVAAVENGKVTVWAGTQTPFPVKNADHAGAAAPGREGARHHAVRRRRLRRQVRVAAGGRGGAAREARRQARARGVGAARRSSSTTRSGRRRSSRFESGLDASGKIVAVGLSRCMPPASAARRTSTTSRTTGRMAYGSWSGAGRPATTRSRSAPGARPAPTPTPSRASRTSTSWRRRPASTRWSSA